MRLEVLRKDPNAETEALSYPDYLLKVGEGWLESNENESVKIPKSVNIVQSSSELIDAVFNGLKFKHKDCEWLTSRAILAPTNKRLTMVNEEVSEKFSGQPCKYLSADSVCLDEPDHRKDGELKYPTEFLNYLETGSALPGHEIVLKKGFPVMLLRNIRQSDGHVNGTRYVALNMTQTLLFLKAVSGTHKGSKLALPRINCMPGNDDFPVHGFRRRQFPILVCFAMTINKSQGQSVPGRLGLDLTLPCFSHGQLYVALSKATHLKKFMFVQQQVQRIQKNIVYATSIRIHQHSVINGIYSQTKKKTAA